MAVHVSIHDVSPVWSDEVRRALDLCASAGARPALLVVPDYHGRSLLTDDPAFCDRLRELQTAGHEVHLHGLLHQAAAPQTPAGLGERVRHVVAQRILSAGEAELAGLTEAEGVTRIARGEGILREAGLRVDGYVAPAWVMPRWLLPALAARGVRYTEGRLRVFDPAAGRSRPSLVLNWATRSPSRMLTSAAWCRVARPARALLPTRIAIHPSDLRSRAIAGEVRSALAWARGDFVATGSDLVRGPA
jgi:predicted deacetylase